MGAALWAIFVFLILPSSCTSSPTPAQTLSSAQAEATTALKPTSPPVATTTVEESPQLPDTPAPTPALSSTPIEVAEVVADTSVSNGAQLALPDGPSVEIPPGALYEDSRVTLKRVEVVPGGNIAAYEIVGDIFEFELAAGDVFAKPVVLEIPYDEELLPDGVPEANLFAVYLHEGEWVRTRTDVDEKNNVLIVHTLHNGIWSWAFETITNIDIKVREFLDSYLGKVESEEVLDQATASEQAKAEVDRRYQEYLDAWNRCDVVAEELAEDINPVEHIKQSITAKIVLRSADALAVGLGGKSAVLTIGGHTVAAWGSHILLGAEVGLYIGEIAGDSILGVRCLLLWESAYRRLQEARAVLEQLEHPDRTSAFSEDAEFLTAWVDLQENSQSYKETGAVDWRFTAQPNSLLDLFFPGSEARYECVSRYEVHFPTSTADDYQTIYVMEPTNNCDESENYASIPDREYIVRGVNPYGNIDLDYRFGDQSGLKYSIGPRGSTDLWLPLDGQTINGFGDQVAWDDGGGRVWSDYELIPSGLETVQVAGQTVEALVYEGDQIRTDELHHRYGNDVIVHTLKYRITYTYHYDIVTGLLVRYEENMMLTECSHCVDGMLGTTKETYVLELVATNIPLGSEAP